ncbi:MAG: hypothetical protein JW753_06280 [Dehalococcoidia bacterium]|nr:hypothetical protein [Dehalococcoidia bacterium]
MKRPPMLMYMRIQGEKGGVGLWLPLFLLLPLALVVFIILSPLILVGAIVLWPSGWGKRAFLALRAALEIFWSMRGLSVDVHSGRQCVSVSVI